MTFGEVPGGTRRHSAAALITSAEEGNRRRRKKKKRRRRRKRLEEEEEEEKEDEEEDAPRATGDLEEQRVPTDTSENPAVATRAFKRAQGDTNSRNDDSWTNPAAHA